MSRGVHQLLTVVMALVALGAAFAPVTASAQRPAAQWALAPLGPFADERVQIAMQLQMETAPAAAEAGVALAYFLDRDLDPSMDPRALLEAAGLVVGSQGSSGIVIERPCRAWSAETSLDSVAMALGTELSEAWGAYDVNFPPCALTPDPALADILVFTAPPEGVDLQTPRAAGSFLGVPRSDGTGGSAGGGPAPSQNGSLGETRDTSPLAMALGVAGAVAVLAGGRLVSAHRAR